MTRNSEHQKDRKEESLEPENDETFAYIAGYTEGGAPYGVTWEEAAKIEAEGNPGEQKSPLPQKSPVSLKELVGELEIMSDTLTTYYRRSTGNFYRVPDEYDDLLDGDLDDALEGRPDWEREAIQEAAEILDSRYDGDFVALPSKFEIHEYRIMEEFCHTLTNTKVANDLFRAISGKGAFGKFKQAIHYHSIQQHWYKFRDDALREIGKEWCEQNKLAWRE